MKSKKNLLVYFALIVLSVIFVVIYTNIFDAKLDSNGDNYHYYILGKSINSGNGYKNVSSPDMSLHNHFPPGYPFLISIFMMVSESTVFIKSINGVFLLLTVIMLFFVFDKFSNIKRPFILIFIVFFCLLNYHLLKSSTIMMSEVPYMFFSVASVLLFFLLERSKVKKERVIYFILLTFCVGLTFYIRTTGVVLFLTIIIYYFLQKKWRYSVLAIVVSALIVLPWQIRNNVNNLHSSYQRQLLSKNPYDSSEGKASVLDFVERFNINTKRYIGKEIPNGLFPFLSVNYNQKNLKDDVSYPFVGVIILLLCILGLLVIDKNIALFLFLYIAGTFTVVLLWPSQWFGVRFLTPLIPVLIFLFFISVSEILNRFLFLFKKSNTAFSIMLFAVLAIVMYKKSSIGIDQLKQSAKNDYPLQVKDFITLSKYCATNIPGDAIVSCRKPGILYTYSNRKSLGFLNSKNTDEVLKYFDDNNVSYVVVDKLGYSSTGKYLVPAINSNLEKFQLIRKEGATETMLFKYLGERK